MADDSMDISPIRLVRWVAVGVLICVAIVLYFRFGTNLPPITATSTASEGGSSGSEPQR
ncbi:MAG TPA: hypothetical protein VLV45_10665 [Gemmatimonadales bacterium]|nr:hypothetical protein [Gemmatimonadales bacterium]